MTIASVIADIRSGAFTAAVGESELANAGGADVVLAALISLLLPSVKAVAVAPSDSTVLPAHRAIYVGGAGDLSVTYLDGTTGTISTVAAGTQLPLSVKKIMAATTATAITLIV